MEIEFIEKQAAIEAMKQLPHEYQTKEQRARTGGIAACQMVVRSLPPADVRPVRRGRWIWEQDDWQNRCSVCRKTFDYSETYGVFDFWAAHYCPNCGADMRGGDAD